MQSLWTGKGDVKLRRVDAVTDTLSSSPAITAETCNKPARSIGPVTIVNVRHTYRYNEYHFRKEEKFLVLPADVREKIENIIHEWCNTSPKKRLSLGSDLGMALTMFAHGVYQTTSTWTAFIGKHFNDDELKRVLRCYKTSVPEPGTYVGEIVAQFFQHCKQQSNLNVKRKMTGDVKQKPTNTNIDKTFEILMSLKRTSHVVVVFRCVLQRSHGQHAGQCCARAAAECLSEYIKHKIFDIYRYEVEGSFVHHHDVTIQLKQFTDTPGEEVYFEVELERHNKLDRTLDILFQSVDVYNSSSVVHRLINCSVVYCSDTFYFIDISQRLFLDNSVTYVFCFLTGKYKPVMECKEDIDAFGLAKILSSIEYATKCSLKRNHTMKMGYGPLTTVISEGGLNESSKYVNNSLRNYIMQTKGAQEIDEEDEPEPVQDCQQEYYEPQSPTYLPTDEPLCIGASLCQEHNHETVNDDESQTLCGNGTYKCGIIKEPAGDCFTVPDVNVNTYGNPNDVRKTFVINEPYINTFFNRPVECGNMF